MNKIIHWDSEIVLSKIKSNTIDMVITSPPYDNMRDYNWNIVWDFNKFKSIARKLTRILKEWWIIVWVVWDETVLWSESCSSFKQAIFFKEECGLNLHDTMIYQKHNFANPSMNRYHQIFEYMFVFSKWKPKTFNPISDRENINTWTRKRSPSRRQDWSMRIKDGIVDVWKYGMRYNIWKYTTWGFSSTKDKIAFKHPAMFPEELVKDHILTWTNPGDLVLDPFAGSGTTWKMAKVLRRPYILIEKEKEYCNISKMRIDSVETIES